MEYFEERLLFVFDGCHKKVHSRYMGDRTVHNPPAFQLTLIGVPPFGLDWWYEVAIPM